MVKLEVTQDLNLINSVLKNPLLYKVTHEDGFPPVDKWSAPANYLYVVGKDEDNNVIGIFRIHEWSTKVIELHPGILPEYWGTGKGNDMGNELKKMVKG